MIIYDLRCDQAHQFEGWFRSADDYQEQQQSGLLCCPVCDSKEVIKIPSASYVQTSKQRETGLATTSPKAPATASVTPSAETLLQQTLANLQEFIRNNSDDVGTKFAEEAKKIHYGEVEKRNIHGQASGDELQELHEEGIEIFALPAVKADKEKLN